ncbi:CDP-glycerol glycerophosphotransferase family protein [Metaplanococcus flavidus]|uniref:CDP-glycerol glycerophosphotransferase family protein n=1 Tax=Metaplanococcus flavidus TaxID=569883 RepID=A0ABW3L9Q7_9BACL
MKELLISLYLGATRIAFIFFKLFPLTNKTVFLSTFGDNAFFTARELASSSRQQLIFINDKKCKVDFSSIPADNKIIYFSGTANVWEITHSIYHLATAKYIFIDNYAGALSAIRFKKEVTCVQLWHAAGAFKKFGWGDPETAKRSHKAKKRFQKVYDQFHYIPVGSQQMEDIFIEAFHLDPSRILHTGVPQTDFYFDKKAMQKGLERIYDCYPVLAGKTVILYAPTFRKDSLSRMKMELDASQFLEALDDSHVLLIRAHPSVQKAVQNFTDSRIILVSDYPQINDLLVVSDILVTDYSSIPVEFSLLQKKMIFFTYDLESYSRTHGLWSMDEASFPGPIARTTAEVITHIKDPDINYTEIDRFKNQWNAFSDGVSARKLINEIYDLKDL